MKCRLFKSVQFFLFCLACVQLGQFLTGSYLRSCISTLERLYGFNSKLSGLLVSATDVGTLCVILFVSYLGRRVHRPRTIAVATLIMAAAVSLFGAIYFVAAPPSEAVKYANERSSGHAAQVDNKTKLCLATIEVNHTAMGIRSKGSNESGYLIYGLMYAALVIFGVGIAPVNPLGVSYLDDAADPNRAPLYVAVLFALSIVGPAFGHLIAAKTLTITTETRGPMWNIGFFIGGALMVIAQISLWFFPKVMPQQKMVKEKALLEREMKQLQRGRSNEAFDEISEKMPNGNDKEPIERERKELTENGPRTQKKDDENKDEGENLEENLRKMSFVGYLKGFFSAAKDIIKEPIWCLMTLMTVIITAMISGIISFQAKYIEVQFGTSAGEANLLLGAINIPVGIVGIVAGGYIMKKRAYTLAQASLHCLFFFSISTAMSSVLLFLGCPTRPIVGVTEHPFISSNELVSTCNRHCGCSLEDYSPICADDGLEFASPCHADCKRFNATSNYFDECGCIVASRARNGKCDHLCSSHVNYFIAADSLVFMLSGFVHAPGYIIFLRSVKPTHKSLAIGLQYLFIRALGKFPSPIYFGAVVDSACLLWSKGGTITGAGAGKKGSCLTYDSYALRIRFWGLSLIIQVCIILIFAVVAVILWRREKNEREEENTSSCVEKTDL